jgi:glycosyltransferase involved in cell wall biosynthesis
VTRVTAFTGGRDTPASRFRIRQYIAPLASLDVQLVEHGGLGAYPPRQRWVRPAWAAAALAARLPGLIASYRSDVTLFQRELLSTFATLERFSRSPRVLDVDDAIWLYRGGRAARAVAKRCALVICGNAYIAEHMASWTPRVALLPTAVDTDRYRPNPHETLSSETVLGWMGTSSNFAYLTAIEPALAAVLEARPEALLLIVSDRSPALPTLPAHRWRFRRWTAEREVADLQSMAVGLMPLADTPWARGKCSFKMLSYMACGLPVVVSPVGMNCDVLSRGLVGLAATTKAEWVDALVALIDDLDARRAYGREGRRVAEGAFSVRTLAPQLASLLTGVSST